MVFKNSDSVYTHDLCSQEWEEANIIDLPTDLRQLKVFEKVISTIGLVLAKIEAATQAKILSSFKKLYL